MAPRQDTSGNRLDDAARAGWLYYVAGNNQEQIAQKLGVSRQTAQRLVSLSVSEGLISAARPSHRPVHGTGRAVARPLCARPDRSGALRSGLGLHHPGRRPGGGRRDRAAATVAHADRLAIGTGRTLKAAIEQLTPMECPQHKIVAGRFHRADGSAAYYNVIFNIADSVKARSFPMPLPVIASSARERSCSAPSR
jgi:DNA-binding transcriptional regulator LsrR (DeoR family)